MSKAIDWLVIGRYALLIALTVLIPVPFLDTGIENALRRRMVRRIADRHGVELSDADIETLAITRGGGCTGCLFGTLLWPLKKVLGTLLVPLLIKGIADTVSEQLHRGLMLEEALEAGWLPGDAVRLRQAMDRTVDSVDTRIVERHLAGVFRDHTNALNGFVFRATRLARDQVSDPADALADAADADELGSGVDTVSRAMAAALQTAGMVPELLQWFRVEMGQAPGSAPAVAGLLEPVVLPLDGPEPAAPAALMVLEDAEEVVRTGEGEE